MALMSGCCLSDEQQTGQQPEAFADSSAILQFTALTLAQHQAKFG